MVHKRSSGAVFSYVLSLGACLLAARWGQAWTVPARSPASPDADVLGALRRREASLQAIVALTGGAVAAVAPQGAYAADEDVGVYVGGQGSGSSQVSAPPSKLQRVVINVGDAQALKNEVKFWTEGLEMQVLREGKAADGLTSTVLGYGPESAGKEGFFAIEVKVDPAVLTRPSPRQLNYEVMQPTVDSLAFVQVSARGKVIDLFTKVQTAGGSALFGDATFLDVESPRGVAVRMVPRDQKPAAEIVGMNVEVPAFEAVTNFYRRVLGMQEEKYPESEPGVQKLSTLLASDAGGVKLLLSPVPDGRLKDRKLDAFENLLIVSPSGVDSTMKAAKQVVDLVAEESAKKEDQLRSKLARLGEDASEQQRAGLKAAIRALKSGTQARPKVVKDSVLDDGVGNFLQIAGPSDFETAR